MAKERGRAEKAKRPGGRKSGGSVKPSRAINTATDIAKPMRTDDLTEEYRGRVAGFSVGTQGLVVKLDVSAVMRLAITVAADEPHFRSAVSMTMIAHNNRASQATPSRDIDHQYLWVKLPAPTAADTTRPALQVGLSQDNSESPFEVADFVT